MFHLSRKPEVLLRGLVPRRTAADAKQHLKRLQVGWSRVAAEIAGMGEIEFDTAFDMMPEPAFDRGFGMGFEGVGPSGQSSPR